MKKRYPRLRWTIAQAMVLILVLAGLLAERVPPQMVLALVAVALALSLFLALAVALVNVLLGIPCPRCACWTLRRLARWRSYYCCAHCGGRFKRFGLGPWLDASGPEDESIYRGKSGARPWQGFVIPEDHDDTTTGALLRFHRRRWRERPAPGAVEPLLVRWRSRIGSWVDFSAPRDPGDTTTGRLLRNQQKRREARKDSPAGLR